MAGAEAMVGAVLNGKWRLRKLLGEGGMGAVFAADGPNGEKRAIKVLHPEFINEPEVQQRFFAEAYAAQHLQHPNVAKVFEHATAEDGSPFLVMELLEGYSLADSMRPGTPVPPQEAVRITLGVLQALIAAHSQNIVHRDLKPDNIFLVPNPTGGSTVKVLDFGIAKVMDAAGGMGSKTRTGVMLGTPGYMSPEQIKNAKAVDPRSDLWSVGVIFYELLTGQPAFEAPTAFAQLTAVLTQDPRPIAAVAPQLASWHNFFVRALAREPKDRFASADEMARTLQATAHALLTAHTAMDHRTVPLQRSTLEAPTLIRSESTHVSAQMPPSLQPRMSAAPPSVQVLVPPAPANSAVMRPASATTGVRPLYVAVIALACFVVGFVGGIGVALVGLGYAW